MAIVDSQFIDLASACRNIAVLWLYGSRAKGCADKTSDYDLGVAFTERLQDPLENRLRPELLSLDWTAILSLPTNKLSVADLNLAPIPLAFEIVSSGKVLYIANQDIYDREFSRVCSMFEIDVVHHRKHYGT